MGNITGRPTVAGTGGNAYLASNDGDEQIDLSFTDPITVLVDDSNAATITDVATSYNFTRNILFVLADGSPVPTAAITITVPATKRGFFVVKNTTSFDATVTISGQSETADEVLSGTSSVFSSDGVNCRIAGGGGGTLESLSDVDTLVGEPTGNVLAIKSGGGAEWIAQSGGSGDALPFTLSPTWRGARASLASAVTGNNITATDVAVDWDTEDEDTDGFWEGVTNPERFTIPNGLGITRVHVVYKVQLSNFTANDGDHLLKIYKNGVVTKAVVSLQVTQDGGSWQAYVELPNEPVSDGDYFDVRARTTSADTTIDFQTNSFGSIKVVETTDAVPSLRTVVQSLQPKHRGALAYVGTDLTTQNFTAAAAIPFNTESFDTDGIHDNVTNNSRMTVPSGVTKIRLWGTAYLSSVTSGVFAELQLRKNGTFGVVGAGNMRVEISDTNRRLDVSSSVMNVTAGDYFELYLLQETDTDITIEADQTAFHMEIVEFATSTDAPVAYIAVPPEHKGAFLQRSATFSIPDATQTPIPWQTATYETSFDPGDGGPPQRFWLGVDTTFVDGDVSVANDEITETAHGYQTGEGPVQLTSTGTLPAGLALATDYWFIRVDANTYKFATSRANALAGTDVDITAAAGGGTHTVNHESKLIVPAGVSKVEVAGNVAWAAGTSSIEQIAFFRKNGATVNGTGINTSINDIASWQGSTSPVLEVSEGDVFELVALQDSTGARNVVNGAGLWAAIKVVEETRAITYPGVTVTPPWRGCLLGISTAEATVAGVGEIIAWDQEDEDTDGFHEGATNPSRITIPTGLGIKRVRISFNLDWDTPDSGQMQAWVLKNGVTALPTGGAGLPGVHTQGASTTSELMNGVSADIAVSDGDYFELRVLTSATGQLDSSDKTFFGLSVVETDENAFPPEPIEFFLNKIAYDTDAFPTTAGEPIFKKVANRRFTLADDFAGSVGHAEATSGATVTMDVNRNGTKIGEISFASGVATATFTTTGATAEVFDVGDRLEVDNASSWSTLDLVAISLFAWRS